MAEYLVDLEQLDGVVADLRGFEAELERQLEALDGRIERLQQSWRGVAADAQAAAHREWVAGATRMRQALADIRAAADTAHANYTATIEANTAMWS